MNDDTKKETYIITPLDKLNPIHYKQVVAHLKALTLEQRLLALLATTMINQLDAADYKLSYVKKNKERLGRINNITAYVPEIVNASNEIWKEAFEELTINVGISTFLVAIIFRRQKQFKKMKVNIKDFRRLNKNHGVDGVNLQTMKLVNLMLKKIDEKLAGINNRIEEKAEEEIVVLREKLKNV